eukprot:7775345-Pyramimonas_sp.AAC.1
MARLGLSLGSIGSSSRSGGDAFKLQAVSLRTDKVNLRVWTHRGDRARAAPARQISPPLCSHPPRTARLRSPAAPTAECSQLNVFVMDW